MSKKVWLLLPDEAEDSDHDDGFVSESPVVMSSRDRNEYYNSLEHVWQSGRSKQRLSENLAKPVAVRGTSESRGSLETDATGSTASDHDYYNELHLPAKSPDHFLCENSGIATSVV